MIDNEYALELQSKISENRELVGIIGLGYVGLPLAVTFAKNGVAVLGFEKDKEKVKKLANGNNYIADVDESTMQEVVANGHLTATDNFARIGECDAILICVPTPLDSFKNPEMSYIESACHDIGTYMRPGTFIALESTTYPTTTEEFMLPILEQESGMRCGKEFFLSYSPERVDPGNTTYKTENTPKVVGSIGKHAQEIALALYGKVIDTIYPVSNPKTAEMVKILENTYRLVNISLVNELALLSDRMGINLWEVIEAAKTKPYGFQAFYPGPGIGGHCIPLDPFYLEYIAKKHDFDLNMIHAAGVIDHLMPYRMTVKITYALNKHKKAINGSRILFLGVAYKPNIADERESPALKIMDQVSRKGGIVEYHDPYIPELLTREKRHYKNSRLTEEIIKNADCVVITTNHNVFNINDIVSKANLVVDLRNAVPEASNKVYKL